MGENGAKSDVFRVQPKFEEKWDWAICLDSHHRLSMAWRKFEKIVTPIRTLWGPLSTPKLWTFLKCFFSSFVKYLDYFWEINDQILMSLPQVRFSSKKKKISTMSHRKQFFKGTQDEQKSKNNFCYKCLKFEKRSCVCSEGSKMLLRKK